MNKGDIPQVNEIDREAFPTLWPPANYRRELENRLAHYLIAVDDKMVREAPGEVVSWWRRTFRRRRREKTPLVPEQYIYGFAGFWIMADEAHITNVAVRERHRREGIGELMLISLLDLATELKTYFVTLEVRASNIGAQNLYVKYGFIQVGVRRGYYTDNREDALLMTVADTTASDFQARFQQLKVAHFNKWGMTSYFRAAR